MNTWRCTDPNQGLQCSYCVRAMHLPINLGTSDIYAAFLLPSQLTADWLRVMSHKTTANCQKWLQLQRDSDDKKNHILSENSPSALLDVLSEITSVCV